MKTGEIIRALREKQGMSQETLAQRLGYRDRSSIAKIETGKVDLSQTKLEQLSRIFNVSLYQLTGIQEMPGSYKVPILGSIACGAPILAQEHIDGYTGVPDFVHADFALVCRGDSMVGARIFDGDLVYIRQQDTVENGEIAAVLIEGEATLKRVRYGPDSVSLQPENPMYRPIILWGEEMNRLRILGKAVAFTASL
jgi:repressor LexA